MKLTGEQYALDAIMNNSLGKHVPFMFYPTTITCRATIYFMEQMFANECHKKGVSDNPTDPNDFFLIHKLPPNVKMFIIRVLHFHESKSTEFIDSWVFFSKKHQFLQKKTGIGRPLKSGYP